MHDLTLENTRTGERLEELDKCKDCFFNIFFHSIPDQISNDSSLYLEYKKEDEKGIEL